MQGDGRRRRMPQQGQATGTVEAWAPPTIKGIFVNSHIRAVERAHGPDGLRRLETLVGRPLRFGATEDVPVSLEVRVLEAAVELLVESPVAEEEVPLEAGRLHYRNFRGTPWARLVFGVFPRDFRFMVLHAAAIAERVFKGVRFEAQELAPDTLKVVMGNADYPLDHFKGFFEAWMADFGARGSVVAQQGGPRRHDYVLRWSA